MPIRGQVVPPDRWFHRNRWVRRRRLGWQRGFVWNRSTPGEEHRYHAYDPVPATPPEIFIRWGNQFAVGAMPLSNVGPDVDGSCGGIDFGLASGTMPYENNGTGMPYEFNARATDHGPPKRTSWDYARQGMQQYMYMLGTVTIMGYWNPTDPKHQDALDVAKRAVEIIRYVGEKKWISNQGPESQKCTSNHGDAYSSFSGMDWGQAMMDAMLFSNADLPWPADVP